MTDHQDYKDIHEATAGAPVTPTFPKAPPVTDSLFDEAMPMLFASDLSYTFTDAINNHNDGKIKLIIPDELGEKDLGRFKTDTWNLTEFNDGNGLTFAEIVTFVEHNAEVLSEALDFVFKRNLIQRTREYFADDDELSRIYLTFNRHEEQDHGLVYAVIKDTIHKRVIVSFRGSQSPFANRDWRTNFNAFSEELSTPDKIADLMDGRLKERLLVHRGFYNYLFDNRHVRGDQPYDRLIDDLRTVLEGEEGYSVCVTGHSLGGALATMFSFKLAGAGKKTNFVPRPVTCITFASPYNGTADYRTAVEHMERIGLLRCLRINNDGDFVPSIPPTTFFLFRLLKHVGINLRLNNNSDCRLEHSSRSGFWTALRNSMFKPIWYVLYYHGHETHFQRLCDNKEKLRSVKLDDLYKDPDVVSRNFLDGKPL